MLNTLLAVELICVLAAAVAGVLWALDPAGPFEPYAFMLTLLGVTGTDLLRRHLAARQERAALVAALVPELCAALEQRLAAVVQTQSDRAAGEHLLHLLRETMLAWGESRMAAAKAPLPAVAAAEVPPQAYGVDGSRDAAGDTTLTQIRLRRKGLE